MRIAKFLIKICINNTVFDHAEFLCKNLNVPASVSFLVDKSLYYTTIHLAALCLRSAIFHEAVSMNADFAVRMRGLVTGSSQQKVVLSSRTVVVRSVRDGWASGPDHAAQTRGLCLSGSHLLAAEGP